MIGFPFLTDEEVMLIANALSDDTAAKDAPLLGKLKREGAEITQLVDFAEVSFSSWKNKGGLHDFKRRIGESLKKFRHTEKLRKAWKRIEVLSDRFRDEYELLLEAFVPGYFDSGSRFLGEDAQNEWMLPDIVKPFLGKAWEIDGFEVNAPYGVEGVEFEVRDPNGVVAYSLRMVEGEKIEIPFSQLEMREGGVWSWCLSFMREDEVLASHGRVSLVPAVERAQIERLLGFADRETTSNGGILMRSLVLMEFDCFDGAIQLLKNGLLGNFDPEFRREALLLLHRTYSKVREKYLELGLESEANDSLRAAFSVERELETLSADEE